MGEVEDVVGLGSNQACASTVNFNIATDHKIDSRAAGYWLSFKMTLAATDNKDFEFSCFDIDITQTGSQCPQYGHELQSA